MDELEVWKRRFQVLANDIEMTEAFRQKVRASLDGAADSAASSSRRSRVISRRALIWYALAAGLLAPIAGLPIQTTPGSVVAVYRPPLAAAGGPVNRQAAPQPHGFAQAIAQPPVPGWLTLHGRIYVVTPSMPSNLGLAVPSRLGLHIARVAGQPESREVAVEYPGHNIRLAKFAYPHIIRYHHERYAVIIPLQAPPVSAVLARQAGLVICRLTNVPPSQTIGLIHGLTAPPVIAQRVR